MAHVRNKIHLNKSGVRRLFTDLCFERIDFLVQLQIRLRIVVKYVFK